MTEKARLDALLKYHSNLSLQLTSQMNSGTGGSLLGKQLTKVEKAIEDIIFKPEADKL